MEHRDRQVQEEAELKLITEAGRETASVMPGGVERRVLSHGGSIMAVHFTFEEGVNAPVHSHPHEQIGYIVAGSLELYLEGHGTRTLVSGCSYYVPPQTPHGVTTLEPTVVLDCFTPLRKDFLVGSEP